MTQIAVIRHGPTDWNEEKRLQGHADRRLSPAGRAKVAGWSVPEKLRDLTWVASPLTRAGETAELLGLTVTRDAALIEMHWGDWEGSTIVELRARYGDEVAARTAKGLDLRPHGGETPREVRARVQEWATGIARIGQPTGAVAHQGIIRALLSLSTGWNMIGKPPHRLDWAAAHVFTVSGDGIVTIGELNISLEPA